MNSRKIKQIARRVMDMDEEAETQYGLDIEKEIANALRASLFEKNWEEVKARLINEETR